MKKPILIYLLSLFFSLSTNTLLSQAPIQFEESFTEATLEDQFRSYLDTINKYTYIDNLIVNYCLGECETLFKKDLKLSDNDIVNYILILISTGLENHEPLKSFQLIQDYQHLLDHEGISAENKAHFSYLSAYTYFILEDTKTAQETFYAMYEEAKVNMDTLNMKKALYSLGQIYSDDESYSTALDYFYQVKTLEEKTRLDASGFCLIQLELSIVYTKLKEYDRALELIEESLKYIDENNIRDLKSDFLLLKGEIAFDRKDFKTAQNTLDETVAFMEASKSYYMLPDSKIFDAKLMSAQGLDKRALKIYETLLKEDNELSNKKKIEIYDLAHALCHEAGYSTKAYQYLMLAKELQMEMQKKAKKQQTAYLKIKFDTAQKEKKIQELRNNDLDKERKLEQARLNMQIIVLGFSLLLLASILVFYQINLSKIKKINHLKNNLSKDLHDNIGTSINHIKMLSNRMSRKALSDTEREQNISKIKKISDEILYNMYDMVWVFDQEKESVGSLLERMQDYADNTLREFGVPFKFNIEGIDENVMLSTLEKINIYMIFKESVNNILKHAENEKVIISFSKNRSEKIKMLISNLYSRKKETDVISNKKGILNLKKRAKDIGGQLRVIDENNNFKIELVLA